MNVRVVRTEGFRLPARAGWAVILSFNASGARRNKRRRSHVEQEAVGVVGDVGPSRDDVNRCNEPDPVLWVDILPVLQDRAFVNYDVIRIELRTYVSIT